VKTIPLADLPLLADATRQTALLRILLAVAVSTTALLAVVAASRPEQREAQLLPPGTTGIVVLDVSASISSDTYARIAETLERLGRTEGRFGLVLFSDVAYEALPPGTPARELLAFRRYFVIPPQSRPGLLPTLPKSPWGGSFSAGTRISRGLLLAYDRIRDERLNRPAILLVSDLDDDAGDRESLTSVALSLERARIPVRVVGLNAAPEDEAFIARLLPRGAADVSRAALPGEGSEPRGEGMPFWLAVTTLVLALLLAANELVGARLRWETA
jgi:hypothetical protein